MNEDDPRAEADFAEGWRDAEEDAEEAALRRPDRRREDDGPQMRLW